MWHYTSAIYSVPLCLPVSIASQSSVETAERIELVWAWNLPTTYRTLSFKEIWLPLKNKGTSLWNFAPNSGLRKFYRTKSIVLLTKLVDSGACGSHLQTMMSSCWTPLLWCTTCSYSWATVDKKSWLSRHIAQSVCISRPCCWYWSVEVCSQSDSWNLLLGAHGAGECNNIDPCGQPKASCLLLFYLVTWHIVA